MKTIYIAAVVQSIADWYFDFNRSNISNSKLVLDRSMLSHIFLETLINLGSRFSWAFKELKVWKWGKTYISNS